MPTDLFNKMPSCTICHDTGVWMNPHGSIVRCPQPSGQHLAQMPGAVVFERAALGLARRNAPVNAKAFEVGRFLSRYTAGEPCPRVRLVDAHFNYSPSSVRNLQATIEELRRVWLLPVGSRKSEPSGYWIITDLNDFAAWVERSKSAPIQQLSTIHRVARANWPHFAEQLELEFWNNIQVTELPDGSGEASVVSSGVT